MSRLRRTWVRCAAAGLLASLLTAADVAAQIGTALWPVLGQGSPSQALITIQLAPDTIARMTTAGGVTLFAASAPNGPLLARVPFLPPFEVDDIDTTYSWGFSGVPPGTYYVAIVLGIVGTPNISAAHWARLVVPGTCTGAPGTGLIARNDAGPGSVDLILSSWGGCASSYLVEVGTNPGGSNVTSFETASGVLRATGVPTGSYYVRVRGRNSFGVGARSTVFPVSVPPCSVTVTGFGSTLQAAVVGSQVTFNWTPVATPSTGGPITFYELSLFQPSVTEPATPRVLVPSGALSLSASLPAGAYTVTLVAGNACSRWVTGVVSFTVP